MAAIPPEFGGAHQFAQNINQTPQSTMISDLCAMNLRLIHMLGPGAGDDVQAGLAEVAAASRATLAASLISNGRERQTRELQPVTRLPAQGFYGANANIANIRLHNLPTFTGGSYDKMDIIQWLSRALNMAANNGLTFDATIGLLVQGSSGGCSDYIEQMRREQKTLPQVVQQLEMRYGDLCSPEEARVKVNTLARKEEEGLPEFIDRLRNMSTMACRMIEDDAARQEGIDTLVEGNIRRALPTSVRNALEERVINRSRMGLPPFNAREIEKECLDLEKRREERKTSLYEQGAVKRHGNIRKVGATPLIDSDLEPISSDSDKEEGEDVYHLIQEVRYQEERHALQGRRFDPQRAFEKGIKNFNRYPQKPQQGRQPYGARQAGLAGGFAPGGQPAHYSGPPNRLEGPRKPIQELLALANIERGCCLQCGQRGHMLKQDACALRDKPLTDRPCAKCGQGLHSADECLRVYQKQYIQQKPDQEPAHNPNPLKED